MRSRRVKASKKQPEALFSSGAARSITSKNRPPREGGDSMSCICLLEQLGMCASTHEYDPAVLPTVIEFVREQKVAADMAFAVSVPVATRGMVLPLRPEQRSRLVIPIICCRSF
jgi:hypothetical protein